MVALSLKTSFKWLASGSLLKVNMLYVFLLMLTGAGIFSFIMKKFGFSEKRAVINLKQDAP